MNEHELLQLKQKIDRAKTKVSELKGKREGLMETLKKKWNCKTVEEAETKLQKMEDNIADLENKRDSKIDELTEKYEL